MFAPPPRVARNVLHLQFIADPLSGESLDLVALALQTYMQGSPVRIGALFSWHSMEGELHEDKPFLERSIHHQFVQ
jgi:hypothetical protein